MGASIAPNGPLGPELRPKNRRFLATPLVLPHEAVLGEGEEEEDPDHPIPKKNGSDFRFRSFPISVRISVPAPVEIFGPSRVFARSLPIATEI